MDIVEQVKQSRWLNITIFIVTAPLLAPLSLKITLPKTASVAQDTERLVVDAQGRVELENQSVTDMQLADLLKQQETDARCQLQI